MTRAGERSAAPAARSDDCRAPGEGADQRTGRALRRWRTVARVTRSHFARFLVEAGHAKNMGGSLQKPHLPAENRLRAAAVVATIKQAIDVIHHSGGKAVLPIPGATISPPSG